MDSTATDRFDTSRFEASRNRLASLAYRLLGSAADAEDAVQDAFLHWQAADRQLIKVPEAWLTKVVTNLCLDRLRSAQARRERTVGAWLPEPLLDGDPLLGPADTFEQRESVSLAVLTLMERLSPAERAVYVLREAFSHSHAEIAEILDITESASQQHLGAVTFDAARSQPCAASPPPPVSPASPRPGGTTDRTRRSSPSGDPTRIQPATGGPSGGVTSHLRNRRPATGGVSTDTDLG